MQREEISAPVLCHDIVVSADIGGKFGYFFLDGVYRHACDDTGAFYFEVSVVFAAVGYGGTRTRGYPHEEFFRFLVSEIIHESFGTVVEVDAYDFHFGSNFFAGRYVTSVRIDEFTVFSEFSSYDRGEKYGNSTFFTGLVDVKSQVVFIGRVGVGIAVGFLFLIIVPELNEYIITFFQLVVDGIPPTHKAERTATVYGMVVYFYFGREESGKYMPPTPFGISSDK